MAPIRFRKHLRKPSQNPKTSAPKEKEICKSFYHQVKLRQQFNQIRNDILIFHVANQQFTNIVFSMESKRMGMMAGVFDYIILIKERVLGGIKTSAGIAFLEFKRDEKGKLTPAQLKFTEILDLFGIKWKVVCTSEQAFEFIAGL
jgi:hypothetical protein